MESVREGNVVGVSHDDDRVCCGIFLHIKIKLVWILGLYKAGKFPAKCPLNSHYQQNEAIKLVKFSMEITVKRADSGLHRREGHRCHLEIRSSLWTTL